MPIKDLSQSLINSVVEVFTQSSENHNKLVEKVVAEGLKHFGVKSVSDLSESDQKAFHAWTQLRLSESDCHCGEVEEDDMPGDEVFHKDGEESGEKKKELDEASDIDYACANCDSKGNRPTDKLNDRHNRDLRYTEYLGLKNLPHYTSAQRKRLDVLKSLRVSDNKASMSESVALGANEIATNGAVGVADTLVATPKHADVIHDTDPYTGVTQYRLLLQYATNEGTRIYPPVSLPGAPSVSDLRTLVQGLPEFNEAVDAALVHASSSGDA